MNEMSQSELKQQGDEISQQIVNRDYAAALASIEQIPLSARTPLVLSAYALCMAAVKGSYKSAVNLCHEAIKKDPKNSEHYYRQGRILFAGRKEKRCNMGFSGWGCAMAGTRRSWKLLLLWG